MYFSSQRSNDKIMLAQGCLTPPDIHPERSLFKNKFYP